MSSTHKETPYVVNRQTWSNKLKALTLVADLMALMIAFAISHFLKFGFSNPLLGGRNEVDITYITLSAVLVVIWMIFLEISGSRSLRVFGDGKSEYQLLAKGTVYFFATVVAFSFLTLIDFARRYLVLTFIVGLLLLVVGRTLVRMLVQKYRQTGRMLTRLMLVGEISAAEHLVRLLKDRPQVGLNPVKVHISDEFFQPDPDSEITELLSGSGADVERIIAEIEVNQIQAVIITDGHNLPPETLRKLGWELAVRDVALMIAPATTDIAGPRIHMTPMHGIPLIHVSTPRLDGMAGAVKRSMDIFVSGLGIIILSPLFLGVALAVKKDGGPAFYSHERIGKDGVPFRMWKFRSMVTNADELKQQLIEEYGGGDALLFKMENDPRITRTGKFIRRYSIDELPQLWNVFVGDMSLVGPRPQVRDEVNQYTEVAHRRLMVSPGVTGLWQVSGRSKLTWEEALRFDLYYVENWSLIGDIGILLRTFKAVFGQDGAY